MPLMVGGAKPAREWSLPRCRFEARPRPWIMGIVNVTPDSFSDGGQFLDPAAAVEQGLRLVDEGADLLDIGGESTRPYAARVEADEELRRVLPVVRMLAQQTTVPLSIDTSKSIVARSAIDAGAQVINDVTALLGDPQMLDVALESRAALCLMHMQGTPQTMQDHPHYQDVVGEVKQFLALRRDAVVSAGVDPTRICLDPGIGFGKNDPHSLCLLRNIATLHELGCPLLVGHSRKGFLARLIGNKSLSENRAVAGRPTEPPRPTEGLLDGSRIGSNDRNRIAATVGVSLALAVQGVHIVRVHDVQATADALTTFLACGGMPMDPPPSDDGRAPL